MLFKKKKDNLNAIKDLTAILKERLLNKEALDYIINKLYYGEQTGHIESISNNGITIINKQNGDTFTLHITDLAIMTDYTCWNGHHQEKKVITFDGEQIVIDYQEATNYVWASSNKPSSTQRLTTTEVYKKNELCYKREFKSSTDSDLTKFLGYTVLTETFINEKREAVERKIASGDYDSFHQPGITYSKTEDLDVPPYDTVHSSRSCYINGFHIITEEEFMAFFNTLEKIEHAPTLRKINQAIKSDQK